LYLSEKLFKTDISAKINSSGKKIGFVISLNLSDLKIAKETNIKNANP
jgi:hypothetical protein